MVDPAKHLTLSIVLIDQAVVSRREVIIGSAWVEICILHCGFPSGGGNY